ncbi:PREDICTED: homeobox protein MOX-2-like [Dinoponera quadriceps]|uniref:Homeobox protein MOX-2-like n=1 Tax=Dinoponera quadriceps TaxID=609295 RepID=A0A6P3XD89_DINQU|nr:PREDICTED: homeobox protein MOX-2-like [Dinoponera quadriceps]
MHLLPYVDSASWLYLDPNPVFSVHLPSANFKCDASLCGQQQHCHRSHHHRHHHHHHHQQLQHYHHRHCRQRRHRRVLSDPGGSRNAVAGSNVAGRHRRVLSSSAGADLMRASIDEANEEDTSPEETGTLTFRKVPWHPNLHMLKIRRT